MALSVNGRRRRVVRTAAPSTGDIIHLILLWWCFRTRLPICRKRVFFVPFEHFQGPAPCGWSGSRIGWGRKIPHFSNRNAHLAASRRKAVSFRLVFRPLPPAPDPRFLLAAPCPRPRGMPLAVHTPIRDQVDRIPL